MLLHFLCNKIYLRPWRSADVCTVKRFRREQKNSSLEFQVNVRGQELKLQTEQKASEMFQILENVLISQRRVKLKQGPTVDGSELLTKKGKRPYIVE